MHSIITAIVFAIAIWLTDANIANTVAMIAGRKLGNGASPVTLGAVMALAWGLFYYLTR